MRQIKINSTVGQNKTVQVDNDITRGDLIKILTNEGYENVVDMAMVFFNKESKQKTQLELDKDPVPNGDVVLYLTPIKNKAGVNRIDAIDSINSNHQLELYVMDNAYNKYGVQDYKNLRTNQLVSIVESYTGENFQGLTKDQQDLGKIIKETADMLEVIFQLVPESQTDELEEIINKFNNLDPYKVEKELSAEEFFAENPMYLVMDF